MEHKLVLVILVLSVVLIAQVQADFYFNRISPKKDKLQSLGLKCMPGRTVMKIVQDKKDDVNDNDYDDGDNQGDTRRTHMNTETNDNEPCQMCTCSVDGKNEYCSKRPARNVNECLQLYLMKQEIDNYSPFDFDRILSYRIRRDYLWHHDEIPYEARAKCRRGLSYYSNSLTAEDSDLEVPSDLDSLLDYSNKSVCWYCVCTVDGRGAGCMRRDVWFCNYYRNLRGENSSRDIYRELFQQDRPSYFRFLSYRMRRTMDDGIYDLLDIGGDTLCCGHPDGHRKSMQKFVRRRVNQLKNKKGKVTKENLMSGHQTGDYVDFIVNNDK